MASKIYLPITADNMKCAGIRSTDQSNNTNFETIKMNNNRTKPSIFYIVCYRLVQKFYDMTLQKLLLKLSMNKHINLISCFLVIKFILFIISLF